MTLEQFVWAAGVVAAFVGWIEVRIGQKVAASEKVQEAKNESISRAIDGLTVTVERLGSYVVDFGQTVAEFKGRLEAKENK